MKQISATTKMVIQIATGIFLPLVVFILAGKYVDARNGTWPKYTLIAVLIAFVITSIFNVFRLKKVITPIIDTSPGKETRI